MVPLAYYKTKKCNVKTTGVLGTKYLYFFSTRHKIRPNRKRGAHRFPEGHPFGEGPHFNDTEFQSKVKRWKPPPYKEFYKRDDVELDRPLVIISNKYTREWSNGPINHLPLETVRKILEYLTPKYHVIYIRFQVKALQDKNEAKQINGTMVEPYPDKDMIRRDFPSVALFEDMSQGLGPEFVNLLMFSLYSLSERF